jgi:glycosyltransferase involved in cell wall biosynthesis
MKVLMILTYYLPHRTGLTLYAAYVAEELVRRGHEVTILSAQHSSELPQESTIKGVKIVRLPYFLRISRGVIMPSYPQRLKELVKTHDIIHVHVPILESALIAYMAKKYHKPLIITHHGDLHLPNHSVFNRSIEKIMFSFYSYAAREANTIFGPSVDYARNSTYLKPLMEKVRLVYPPIIMEKPDKRAVKKMRKKLGLKETVIIGYSGRFVEEKRPDLLLDAIPELEKVIPKFKIILVGKYAIKYEHFYNKCLPKIRKYQDHLIFLGEAKTVQDMANFYTLCDVLVLPSGTECFGMVQVEAMLCGTPVIANDVTGAREAVRVTHMGKIVDTKNPKILAEAISEIATNKKKYVKSRHAIENAFSLQRTVDNYEKVFIRAIAATKILK